MHHYSHHIGDYRGGTTHLTNEEDLAYRRLLDMYYDQEGPIRLETRWVARRLRVETQVVIDVLEDMFEKGSDGWHNARCDADIAAYHAKAGRNRENGKRGGRPTKDGTETQNNPDGSQTKPTGKATVNRKPVPSTKNQPDAEPACAVSRPTDAGPGDGFDEFWEAYGKKASRPKAVSAWGRMSKKEREAAMGRVAAYVAATPDKEFRKNPQGWLNQRMWEDEIVTKHPPGAPVQTDFANQDYRNGGKQMELL